MSNTWKDRCNMQIKNFVQSTMNIYGCSEEDVYKILHKRLCQIGTYKLADVILGKCEENE